MQKDIVSIAWNFYELEIEWSHDFFISRLMLDEEKHKCKILECLINSDIRVVYEWLYIKHKLYLQFLLFSGLSLYTIWYSQCWEMAASHRALSPKNRVKQLIIYRLFSYWTMTGIQQIIFNFLFAFCFEFINILCE